MDDIPHLALPLRIQGATYASVQQDTADELATNVAVIVAFERGTRAESMDFGITNPTFQLVPVDVTEIEQQVSVYEPRAVVRIALADDRAGAQRVQISVGVGGSEEPI